MEHFNEHHTPELTAIHNYVKSYEAMTGLCADHISHDEHSFWIRWVYPDSSWAGTTAYDMPLSTVVEKMSYQLSAIEESLELAS